MFSVITLSKYEVEITFPSALPLFHKIPSISSHPELEALLLTCEFLKLFTDIFHIKAMIPSSTTGFPGLLPSLAYWLKGFYVNFSCQEKSITKQIQIISQSSRARSQLLAQ